MNIQNSERSDYKRDMTLFKNLDSMKKARRIHLASEVNQHGIVQVLH